MGSSLAIQLKCVTARLDPNSTCIWHRLLDWKIPITDESFEALVQEPISIEQIREELRADVAQLEVEAAKVFLKQETSQPPLP
jgi:hypothetical protein